MTLNPITKTAANVGVYVKRQFGDESGVQITDQDIIRWVNSAQLEIVTRTAPIKAKGQTNIVSGQDDYDLTGLNVHQIESVHFDGKYVQNVPFAEAERDIISKETSLEASNIPTLWYEWAGIVTLWPTPNVDITNGLTIYYTKMPIPVVLINDALSLPDKYFEAIVSWVLAKAYELDEEFDESANQRSFFDSKVSDQNGEEMESSNMVYSTITFVED